MTAYSGFLRQLHKNDAREPNAMLYLVKIAVKQNQR
jgi:hypothetical protein